MTECESERVSPSPAGPEVSYGLQYIHMCVHMISIWCTSTVALIDSASINVFLKSFEDFKGLF